MVDEDGLFMRVRWFGNPWPSEEARASVCEDDEHRIDVPVGTKCLECSQLIGERDRGIVTACSAGIWGSWELPDGEYLYRVCSYHLKCFLHVVVGEEMTGEMLARMKGATVRKAGEVSPISVDEPDLDDEDIVPGRGWGNRT